MGVRRGEDGQATIELVALLPLLGVLVALLWQALLAGEAIWLSATAARVASRAAAVGADPVLAARRVLPTTFERRLQVETDRDGGVAVVVGIPAVVAGGTLAAVTAHARFEAQR